MKARNFFVIAASLIGITGLATLGTWLTNLDKVPFEEPIRFTLVYAICALLTLSIILVLQKEDIIKTKNHLDDLESFKVDIVNKLSQVNTCLENEIMQKIIPKFINDNEINPELEDGIIKLLNKLKDDYNSVYFKLYEYALATQYVGENVVILNAPMEGDHILKSFFNNKDNQIEKHIDSIDLIRFLGTGRGATKNGNRTYNFYEPLTDFLKTVFSKNTTHFQGIKGIGSKNPREQACFRAFMYRIVYFLLVELKNKENFEGFYVTFIFPQYEVFPGQLTIGNVKSMFNVSIGAEDTEDVMLKMPIALQVNSYGKDEKDQEIPILPKTINRINIAFDNRFEDYNLDKEKWIFRKKGGKYHVEVIGINKDNLMTIINDIDENELSMDQKERLLRFANCSSRTFTDVNSDKNELGIIIESLAHIGYNGELPDLYKSKILT